MNIFLINAYVSNLLLEVDKTKTIVYDVETIDTSTVNDKLVISNGKEWIPIDAIIGIKVNPILKQAVIEIAKLI